MNARIAWFGRDDPEGAAALVIEPARAQGPALAAIAQAHLRGQPVIVVLDGHPDPFTLRIWQDSSAWVVLSAGRSPESLTHAISQVIAQHQPSPHQRLTSALADAELVSLRFQTLDQAESAAEVLTATLPASPLRKAATLELLLNAVEHGNLGVTGAEKQELLKTGRWAAELNRRLGVAPWVGRWARATVSRHEAEWTLEVVDAGTGFDFPPPPDSTHQPRLHGRGIALAREAFDGLQWFAPGNHVVARVRR